MKRSDVKISREVFCSAHKLQAPSTGGVPSTFNTNQLMNAHIYCDCPIKMLGTIPMTLLHPAFGQFQDDCEMSIPAAEDFQLLGSIVDIMSRVYNSENERKF